MSHVSAVTTDGRGKEVGGCIGWTRRFSFTGKMLICRAFMCRRCRRCSFVSCFQWIVNKQHLLSLQTRDGRLVSVLVSAIPIPNRYHWYRPDTDTEYWYRSKPKFIVDAHVKTSGLWDGVDPVCESMCQVLCGMRKVKCGIQNAERSAEWWVKRGMRKGQSAR